VELRSEVSGRITGIFFKEGQHIKKGTLLVKIYDQELRAQLKRVRTQQQLAKIDEERKRKLIEIKGISQQEYDIAKNQTELLNADAELIEAQLRKSSIYAPFDGVIGLRYSSEGESVSPTTPIASFQQIDPIRIEFDIPEKYNDLVGTESTINFTESGNPKVYKGSVYAVEQMIDAATGTLKVRARSSNKDMSLKPGSFIKIDLLLNTDEKAIILPSESVIPGSKSQKVFLYKNGISISKEVETGVRQEQTLQITSGLQPNDTVITSGTMQLKDSSRVNIKIIK
jgi:membrane fusion protein (multidrug efflux system)